MDYCPEFGCSRSNAIDIDGVPKNIGRAETLTLELGSVGLPALSNSSGGAWVVEGLPCRIW